MTDTRMPRLAEDLADIESIRAGCELVRRTFRTLQGEIGRAVVGQRRVVDETLVALFAGGHVLLEGVPGLGKTLLVRTLSEALQLDFSRIQFTPDLMPADITGTNIVARDESTGRREFCFRPGPIFSQLVLADEINRATPKSQAALLEAMQEGTVTCGGETRPLPDPFFVMATQNPIEQEGTYPLPEAQLDRFLLKIVVPYATRREVGEILERTTGSHDATPRPTMDGAFIRSAQRLVRQLVIAPHVQDYVVRLVLATHPGGMFHPDSIRDMVSVGVSPRGGQAIINAAKVVALMDGRFGVSVEDVRSIAHVALRHRIVRSFEAETDRIETDELITAIIESLPRTDEGDDAP
ncbi:MAG: AAA family ATPase [Phycisphaerales bacterium]|nr:AAA family ATPase [Phycisphaerales bacterium]